MLEALGLGLLAQSSLLLAGLIVFAFTVPRRVVGVLAGFGGGALLAAISFDLLPEADALGGWELGLWMLVGAAVFVVGDKVVERRFGNEGAGASLGIILGSVVDGVPESLIFGIQLAAGVPVSTSFLVAVFVSNIPQALGPSADLANNGWGVRRLGRVWLLVVLACGLAAALGFVLADAASDVNGTRMAALAAGGLIAMLTNSLMPFAYERGAEAAGVAAVVGFCLSVVGTNS